MKHIHKIFLFLFVSFLFTNCKKGYLDINQDPNRVTDQNVTPELIFPAACEESGATTVGARANNAGAKPDMEFLENWVGYFASNADFSRDGQETTYNIDNPFSDEIFAFRYHALYDLHQAEVKGLAKGDSAIAGASIILSVKGFQELVDLFGNIPYSQAFKASTITLPKYDKAQDIYNSLLLRLDTAILYLSHPAPNQFAPVDIVNKGNLTKWIHFANTLKLRLLIRQSEVVGFNPAPEIAKIIAKGGPLISGETVAENPGYLNDVNKQDPFYAFYGFTTTGNLQNTGEDANLYIINILKTNSDPRIGRFFSPVGTAYVGNTYGDINTNLTPGNKSSYFGPGLVGTFPSGATQSQWIMPAYESLFFQAEAIARGWMPGNAQSVYAAAVKESFSYTGVANSDSAATAYMANNTSANYANAGGTSLSQAKFIAYQKYIANTGFDPLESYSDIRRLNVLTDLSYISVNPAIVSKSLPLRLAYPQREITTNGANVALQGKVDPFTSKLFWQP